MPRPGPRPLSGKAGHEGNRARPADIRVGGAHRIELAPEPHLEGRACLVVGELQDRLVEQRIADSHSQVVERAETGEEPLQHWLICDVDAFAAHGVAEPNERSS
jgi:hypothetical protein